jgi:hypothetical protein
MAIYGSNCHGKCDETSDQPATDESQTTSIDLQYHGIRRGHQPRALPQRLLIPPVLQSTPSKILIVDLNNFAYYPTIAIGYIAAALRRASFEVDVLSPLAHGVPSAQREKRETLRDHLYRRVSFSTQPWILRPRAILGRARSSWKARPELRVDGALSAAIERMRPDAVLISTYTDSYPLVERLCHVTQADNIPTLVGGPILNQPSVAAEWRELPGIRGIVGGEVERTIVDMVHALLAGEGLTKFPGFLAPDGTSGPASASLRDHSAVGVSGRGFARDLDLCEHPGRGKALRCSRGP